MCQETSAYVISISYGVVYGGTYVWLEWCPLGYLAACVAVCAVRVVVSRSVLTTLLQIIN